MKKITFRRVGLRLFMLAVLMTMAVASHAAKSTIYFKSSCDKAPQLRAYIYNTITLGSFRYIIASGTTFTTMTDKVKIGTAEYYKLTFDPSGYNTMNMTVADPNGNQLGEPHDYSAEDGRNYWFEFYYDETSEKYGWKTIAEQSTKPLTFNEETVEANALDTIAFKMNFQNTCDYTSLQANFTLPEGLQLISDEDSVALGDKVTGANLIVKKYEGVNKYNVQILTQDQQTVLPTDALFTFKAKAITSFTDAEVKVSNIIASTKDPLEGKYDDITATVSAAKIDPTFTFSTGETESDKLIVYKGTTDSIIYHSTSGKPTVSLRAMEAAYFFSGDPVIGDSVIKFTATEYTGTEGEAPESQLFMYGFKFPETDIYNAVEKRIYLTWKNVSYDKLKKSIENATNYSTEIDVTKYQEVKDSLDKCIKFANEKGLAFKVQKEVDSTQVALDSALNAAQREISVIKTIDEIGNIDDVYYTDECRKKIEYARDIYDDLWVTEQKLVYDSLALFNAEKEYKNLTIEMSITPSSKPLKFSTKTEAEEPVTVFAKTTGAFSALQFNLILPENVTLVDTTIVKGSMIKDEAFSVQVKKNEKDEYVFVITAEDPVAFNTDSCDLVSFRIKASKEVTAEYVWMTNVIASTNNNTPKLVEPKQKDATNSFKYNAQILMRGDADDDWAYTVNDYNWDRHYVLGIMDTPLTYTKEFLSADCNADKSIDVSDCQAIVDSINGFLGGYAKSFMGATQVVEGLSFVQEGNTLRIVADNASEFLGCQMDITLPAGVKVMAKASDANHTIAGNFVKGAYRVLVTSEDGATFSDNTVATLTLSDAADVTASNIIFANTACQSVKAIAGKVTGINDANVDANAKGGKFVKDGQVVIKKNGKTYNVKGQLVK